MIKKGSNADVPGNCLFNGKEIMRDVMLVEPVPEGIRLVALFEPVQVIQAAIRQIDLMKHQVILESLQENEKKRERSGEIEGAEAV